MQITRSATSVSWIPSDSIPGLLKIPMEKGLMHYDPPPPLALTDLEGMRHRGEFRLANILRAWIQVEDGTIRDYGYAGGAIPGLTPFTAGPLRVGSRPGFSFLRPSAHWPFLLTRPFTIWTTIELTINADGTYPPAPGRVEPISPPLALRQRGALGSEVSAHPL